MPTPDFEYGFGAVVAPDQQDRWASCKQNLIAATRPGTLLEQLVVDQLLHAQWELHRVNQLANNTDAEDRLTAAQARASRNWQRANRELTALQTARFSRENSCFKIDAPCADFARVPKPKPATKQVIDSVIAAITRPPLMEGN